MRLLRNNILKKLITAKKPFAIGISILCIAALASCSSSATNDVTNTANPTEQYYCQPDADNAEWDCTNKTTHDFSSAQKTQPAIQHPTTSATEKPGQKKLVAKSWRRLIEPMQSQKSGNLIAGSKAIPPPSKTLASNDKAIIDDSADRWAMQLIAMRDRSKVEDLLNKAPLEKAYITAVYSKGQIFYALVLSPYESKEEAKRAARNLRAPYNRMQPFLRSMKSLSRAANRAEERL